MNEHYKGRPFTPVKQPKVVSKTTTVTSLDAQRAMDALRGRERDTRNANRLRFVGGWSVMAAAGAVVPLVMAWKMGQTDGLRRGNMNANFVGVAVAMDTLLLLITFPFAIFTAPASRSDRVNQFLEHGKSAGGRGNTLLRLVLIVAMLGLLFGEFLVIDAVKSLLLRYRLRHVDRHRAAIILGTLQAEPRGGLDPRTLAKADEDPYHFRELIAYLMAYEWADLSPRGDWMQTTSKSKLDLKKAGRTLFAVGG